MEQIQQILSALLQKIPDAQQQQANGDRELATKEEVAKLSAEVKLLSEKFGEKCAMEKVNKQQWMNIYAKQIISLLRIFENYLIYFHNQNLGTWPSFEWNRFQFKGSLSLISPLLESNSLNFYLV